MDVQQQLPLDNKAVPDFLAGLKRRAMHHCRGGKRLYIYERVVLFAAALAQLGVVVALAAEFLTPAQAAVATVLPGALLALPKTMGWKKIRCWRYRYYIQLEDLHDRVLFDMVGIQDAVLEKHAIAETMHEEHPQLSETA